MTHPDQDIARWDAHAAAYERMFEPLTDAFARHALSHLAPLDGEPLIDIAAGAGGAALIAAEQGAEVTAIDASPAMVARLAGRASASVQGGIVVRRADAAALPFPDGTFTRALSSFGITLMPDPAQGAAEMRRVLRPGGRAAIVTWTEPQNYALSARLRDAAATVCGPQPMGPLPPQLRHADPGLFTALLASAGFTHIELHQVEAMLPAASARDLAAGLGFAPGMSALLDAMGPHRGAVLRHFVDALEVAQGLGPVALPAVAHIAIASAPSP